MSEDQLPAPSPGGSPPGRAISPVPREAPGRGVGEVAVEAAAVPVGGELPGRDARRARRIVRVAWLGIVVGLAVEALQLGVLLVDSAPDAVRVALDLVQKVSWSALVCTGLALGLTAAPDARVAGGLAGLLSAPLAFAVARALHAAAARTLGVDLPAAGAAVLAAIAAVKALEYGFLGFVLGGLETRQPVEVSRYLGVGALVGVVFGAVVVGIQHLAAPMPPPALVTAGRVVNELVFPMGCALAVYGSREVGRRLFSG